MDTPPNEPANEGDYAAGQVAGQGRFELVQQLGRGGMGVVWLAKDLRLGEQVALKFLPLAISDDAVAIEDMRRETLKSRKLSHPNIIRIYDFYEAAGEAPFISMEYVDGWNMSTLRLQQPQQLFSWDYLKPLVEQICDALDYAHGEKIVHRDIKPSNLMLDSQGRLKLADFGIAATISDTLSRVSLRNTTSGTMTYMSPQQMEGEVPRVTDDIYALGATLYEFLTSRPPFYTGDIGHQVLSVPAKPMNERLADLGLINPIPPEEAAMVMACLAKEPKKRPQSARMVAEWVGLQVRRRLNKVGSLEAVENFSEEQLAEGVEAPKDYIEPFGAFRLKKSFLKLGLVVTGLAVGGVVVGVVWSKRAVKVQADASAMTNAPVAEVPVKATNHALQLDPSFDVGDGPNELVQCAVLQADGKMVIGGRFTQVGQAGHRHIARLNADGSVDTSFSNKAGADSAIVFMALQPDGKILVGGEFTKFAGAPHYRIVRLNPDGQVDGSFKNIPGADEPVHALAVQPDGKILIGGYFKHMGGAALHGIARLNSNGSLDASFKPGTGANDGVRAIAVLPDGKILINGYFTEVNGVPSGRIARLNPDGSLDKSFQVGTGANAPIERVTLLPDGKLFVNGAYSEFNGVPLINFVRLNADGSIDQSFKAKRGSNQPVRRVIPLPDGRMILAGEFVVVENKSISALACLLPDGTLDESFKVDFGPDTRLHSAQLQPDGKLVIFGSFSSVAGTTRHQVARLQGL